ncbi:hypothetical protein A3751_01520, partial [Oleiphilus sp. HI0080]
MAKELELKLSCTEALSFAQLEQAMLSTGAAQTDLTQSGPAQADVTQDNAAQIKIMQLENIYFDTEDLTLHKNKVALRIRKKGVAPNTRYIQTLKTAGKSVNGVSQRGEWEWELAKPILSTKALESLDVWTAQLHATNLQLKPVFRTDFQRTAKIVQWGGHHFELVLDEGEITVPGTKKAQPIHEVEIEYLGSAKVCESVELDERSDGLSHSGSAAKEPHAA